ncbi:MAG: response regulator [Hyphomicrobiaceae bacterium]|nr:response regulator [Hyphomicrobiaceae bacterium]
MGVQGLRVILVEDEALLLLEMQDMLEDLGCVIVGTAGRLPEATALANTADFDVALLDMNIQGQRIDPVARIVKDRCLPIIFVTGYGARTLPPGVAAPVIDKPCSRDKLRALLAALEDRRHG